MPAPLAVQLGPLASVYEDESASALLLTTVAMVVPVPVAIVLT